MSVPMRPDDPAYFLLTDDYTTTPVVHDPNCYICLDPEFAQMGLPLCRPCPKCSEQPDKDIELFAGHISADDAICTSCGYEEH